MKLIGFGLYLLSTFVAMFLFSEFALLIAVASMACLFIILLRMKSNE